MKPSLRLSNSCLSRLGFTLMEMLVAIGVLAVLAALLFPVALSIVKSGQATSCVANLRNIGVDVRSFAAENDGYLPANSSSATSTAWWYVLYRDDAFQNFNKRMVCPSDPDPYIYKYKYKKDELLKTSYRYNARMGRRNSSSTWILPQLKLHLIRNAHSVPLVVDWNDPEEDDGASDSRTFGSESTDQLLGRHGRFSNVLFLDGHVGRLTGPPDTKSGEWNWVPSY